MEKNVVCRMPISHQQRPNFIKLISVIIEMPTNFSLFFVYVGIELKEFRIITTKANGPRSSSK